MKQDPKDIELKKIRLGEVSEGSKSIAKRLETVSNTDLELEDSIQVRNSELEIMKNKFNGEVGRLKTEVISMKRDVFALRHSLKVTINLLRTMARKKEFDAINEKVKRWAPFNKATRQHAEHIIKGVLKDK